MGNVWRILGIVLISMVLGLTSLFLLLFTICGGFKSSGGEGAMVMLVSSAIIVGGIAGIVWLGRGIAASRPAPAGLAVPPSHEGVAPHHGGFAQAVPAAARAPLTGADQQLLIFLRILLVGSILLALGMAALTFVRLQGAFNTSLSFQMVFAAIIGVLPAALLVLTLRNPPSGVALDLIAGMAIASVLFRGGSLAVYNIVSQLASSPELATYLMRSALFTLLDVAIAGLAIAVRRKVDTTTFARLLITTAGFLIWEWLTQMMWRLFI